MTATEVGAAPYLDPARPVVERVADLLSRMSPEQKVGQMMQLDAREDLDDRLLDGHVGSILHASPEHLARAHELVARTELRLSLIHI